MRWFSLASPVVERRYVFTRLKAENDRSLEAFVAGITNRITCPVGKSQTEVTWESSID